MGQGQSGPQGPQGSQGPRGDPGPPGAAGKDATVDLKQVSDSIIVNKSFQTQFVPLISKDITLASNVSKEVVGDKTFSNTLISSMAADERFKGPPGKDSAAQDVANLLGADTSFTSKLAPFVVKDTNFVSTVGQQLSQNTAFSNSLLGTMATDARFKGPKGEDSKPQDVANTLASNATFTSSVGQQITQNSVFSNSIINTMAADTRFRGKDGEINVSPTNAGAIAEKLSESAIFNSSLADSVAKNNLMGSNVATNIVNNNTTRTQVVNDIVENQNYKNAMISAMAARTEFRGPRGETGAATNPESLRIAVEPRSLWCADGQMCRTPTNSPGTIITGDLIIGGNATRNNVRITAQGNVAINTAGSLNIGSWTISENTAGNLQFMKNGFTNGNVIFDAGRYQSNQMTITAGNLISSNDLWSNYIYSNNSIRLFGSTTTTGSTARIQNTPNNSSIPGIDVVITQDNKGFIIAPKIRTKEIRMHRALDNTWEDIDPNNANANQRRSVWQIWNGDSDMSITSGSSGVSGPKSDVGINNDLIFNRFGNNNYFKIGPGEGGYAKTQ